MEMELEQLRDGRLIVARQIQEQKGDVVFVTAVAAQFSVEELSAMSAKEFLRELHARLIINQ